MNLDIALDVVSTNINRKICNIIQLDIKNYNNNKPKTNNNNRLT